MTSATYVIEVIREQTGIYFWSHNLNLSRKTWKLLYLIHLTMSETFVLCIAEPSEKTAKGTELYRTSNQQLNWDIYYYLVFTVLTSLPPVTIYDIFEFLDLWGATLTKIFLLKHIVIVPNNVRHESAIQDKSTHIISISPNQIFWELLVVVKVSKVWLDFSRSVIYLWPERV